MPFKKCICILVLYNPPLGIESRVIKLLDTFEFVYVWDNSAHKNPEIEKIALTGNRLDYECSGDNIGLAKAYNKGIDFAIKKGFEYYMTLDQDSNFSNLKLFVEYSLKLLNDRECIIGPNPFSCENIIDNSKLLPVDWVINSGLFTKISIANKIGNYNEHFFVDGVDMEFCLRASSLGIFSFYYLGCNIIQNYGIPQYITLFNRKIHYNGYKPERICSILSTHLYLYRVYKKKHLIRDFKHFVRLAIRAIILCPHQKIARIKALFTGIFYGINCKINNCG